MKKLGLIPILLLLLLCSCSVPKFHPRRQVSAILLESFIPLELKVDKAICDPISKSVYALSRARQQVDVYKGNTLVNSIGGLGTQNYNFQRLTDIGLDADGSLLALDQMSSQIKKFSADGRYIASFDLYGTHQPEFFCMSMDRELYVYDASSDEIVNISLLDGKEVFRFGRFQLQSPSAMSCNRELVCIYSSQSNQSQIYNSLGQYLQNMAGQVLPDSYGNLILVDGQISSSTFNETSDQTPLLPILEAGEVTISADLLVHSGAWGLNIYKISYQTLQP